MCSMTDSYAMNIIPEESIVTVSRRLGVPSKIVDTCGLADSTMAYRMWCESLFSPCTPVTFTGVGMWMGDNIVCYTTVNMMSVIVNHDYIITATTCSRGQRYQF